MDPFAIFNLYTSLHDVINSAQINHHISADNQLYLMFKRQSNQLILEMTTIVEHFLKFVLEWMTPVT